MKTRIKFMTFLFTIALLILPISVFASDNVAKIGENEYTTLKSAVDVANSGETITILKNTTSNDLTLKSGITLVIPTDITLTLGGNVVAENGAIIKNNGMIVVDGGTLDASALASSTTTGLVLGLPGTVSIKSDGRLILPTVWHTMWQSSVGLWEPNGTYATHLFTGLESGAALTINNYNYVYVTNTFKGAIQSETNYYTTFESALSDITAGDTVKLLADISVPAETTINKNININLNGFNISAVDTVFIIQNAKVDITGKGIIYEMEPNYAPIFVKGSNVETDTDYTVVTIGKDVTLRGWAGVFIREYTKGTISPAYGVKINFYGTIEAVNDTSNASGHGIYINGNIKQMTNYPIININSGSKITSTGPGIYAAGYAKWNINGATITGVESGLGIKSGIFNITNSKITGTGSATLPPAGYSNGINASGAAIQIESNKDYAGDVELNITSGTFTSEKSVTLYEYVVSGTTGTKVKSISIMGGDFNATDENDSIIISKELTAKVKEFIKGGSFYINDISLYLASGYQAIADMNTAKITVSKATVPTGTYTLSGTITNGNNANVRLIQGGLVVKSVIASETGAYSFTGLARGTYNIIANSGTYSVTKLIEITENTTQNLTIGIGNINIFVAGSEKINLMVGGLQEQFADGDITILTISDGRHENYTDQNAILEESTTKKMIFMDLFIVVGEDNITTTDEAVELVLPFDLNNKNGVTIFRYHDQLVDKFTALTTKPSGDYVDKTCYVDKENNLIYIYSNKFSTYGIGYNETSNPETSDNIMIYIGIAIISIITIAIVCKKKKI